MAKDKKDKPITVYRIRNTRTNEYVKMGTKITSQRWTGYWLSALSNPSKYEVEMCELVVVKRFTHERKNADLLTRAVLFEKIKKRKK